MRILHLVAGQLFCHLHTPTSKPSKVHEHRCLLCSCQPSNLNSNPMVLVLPTLTPLSDPIQRTSQCLWKLTLCPPCELVFTVWNINFTSTIHGSQDNLFPSHPPHFSLDLRKQVLPNHIYIIIEPLLWVF